MRVSILSRLGYAFWMGLLLQAATAGPARATGCPDSCDETCGICCTQWEIRAVCGNGKGVASEGGFSSWKAASHAAWEANEVTRTCTPGTDACRETHSCSNRGEVAVWIPYCVERNRQPDLERTAALQALEGQSGAVDNALRSLSELSKQRLTTSARGKSTALQQKLRSLSTQLGEARDRVKTPTAKPDTKGRGAASLAALLRTAAQAVEESQTVASDPTSIDTAAVERERKKEEEKERARAAAAKAPEPRTPEPKQPEPVDRSGIESEAASIEKLLAEARSEAEQASNQLNKALREAGIAKARKAEGEAISRRLSAALGKIPALRAQALEASKRRAVANATAALSKTRADATALLEQLRREQSSASAFVAVAGSVAPPPVSPAVASKPRLIPTCEVAFEPEDGSSGMVLVMDGKRELRIPGRMIVSSGRHSFQVKRGKSVETRTELIVCGRVDRINVAPLAQGAVQ